MKKFLFLIVCLLTVAGAYSAEPVFRYTDGRFSELEFGVTAEGQTVSVGVEKKGNDAVYTIYNPDFSIERTFTIKGAYTNSAEIEENWDNPAAQHPDYTEPSCTFRYNDSDAMDILAIQGLGQDRSKWYVFVSNSIYYQDEEGWGSYSTDSFSVYDESGSLIGSINVDDYYDWSIRFYKFGAKMYLVFKALAGPYEYTTTNFYDLSGTSGINAPVAVKRSSRAYPNPLHQGKSFTIELSETAPEGSKVVVSDMNGSMVYRASIQPGADKVIIPSRKLRNGNLVYSVYAGETVLEKGKIIVR